MDVTDAHLQQYALERKYTYTTAVIQKQSPERSAADASHCKIA